MQVFTTATSLTQQVRAYRTQNPLLRVGFVPTMGALHFGHIRLIEEAKNQCDLVICSIFVNPTQFNDPADLLRYPRTLERDIDLLDQAGCHWVYTPDVDDVYPPDLNSAFEIDFAGLDQVMEGAFRPGHFKGVAQVVNRLFSIAEPHYAFFGRKDFQQVAIIKHLVKVKNIPVQIVPVDTVRSDEGLALSSRNSLLSDLERKESLIIYKTLLAAQDWSKTQKDAAKLKIRLVELFNQGTLQLQYLEICDNDSLRPVSQITSTCTCCIAAFCGKVRLIDNLPLL